MKKIPIAAILVFVIYLIWQPVSATKITAEKVSSKIIVSIDGELFTWYVFLSNEKYPVFFPVNGLLTLPVCSWRFIFRRI